MNGKMLEELRSILEEDTISPKVATRLTLSALAEVTGTLSEIGTSLKNHLEENPQDKVIAEIVVKVDDINAKLDKLSANPAVKLGVYVSNNPKMFAVMVIIAVMAISVFGRVVLPWLGVPIEIVEVLSTPIPTPFR